MIQKIIWNPSFNLGIDTIDEDHKELVEITNALYDAIVSNKNPKEMIINALLHLKEYTHKHFKNEEKFMRDVGFANYKEHVLQHSLFKKKILEYQNICSQKGSQEEIEQFYNEIANWILTHILKEDMELRDFTERKSLTKFDRISIDNKLSIIVIVPSIIAAIALVMIIFHFTFKYNQISQLYKDSSSIQNIALFSTLLQKERGLSVAYLGNQGEKFTEGLIKHRKTVNETYENSISKTKNIENIYKEILQYRGKVDAKSVTSTQVLLFYTDYINTLISKSDAITLALENPSIKSKAVAFNAVFHRTEIMGLQRALGTVIIQNNYSLNQSKQFISLFAEENFYEKIFKNSATENNFHLFQTIFHTNPLYLQYKEEVTLIINSLLDPKHFTTSTLDEKVYFDFMSKNILHLNSVLYLILQDFTSTVNSIKESLEYTITLSIFLFLSLIALSLYIYRKVKRSISEPLQTFSTAIQILEKSKEKFYTFEKQNREKLGFLLKHYTELKLQFLRSDIKEIFQHQKHHFLEKQATIDPLTNIFNRRKFDRILQEKFTQAKLQQGSYSILMLDIDHFKKVNDTYGHNMGDYILKELAATIKLALDENQIFARVGGEEFIILLEGVSQQEALTIAKELRATIAKNTISQGDISLNITLSIGLSHFSIDDEDSSTAIKNADKALYRAKESGRNRVCT